ncbi:uncharacterized protein LACBIDRAFT_324453 [Laccaria bicolor S238N-H82]|uniref:Predicted protein n=1 Tax=Laccaria bicolor (strain S238N-H82 / ATCC MYA-4686) TaxID=486041 RepID=B0D1V4_LACBS|nr:uncharacterized protein LACBIDRAFT_324453 [Laccaria bicolor S238N-H82]EDR11709.1 predicted protein [Laccaria bicolor S238N-H82]|eukprot:XP_001877606.1 predicted protein [Laccaria bicolor S238N-H82]
MDARYNKTQAMEDLIRYTEARGRCDIGTDCQQLLEVDIDKLEIVAYTRPDTYRLCKFDEKSDSMQEVIVRLQGIFAETHVKKIRGLRQAVQVTGLGEDIFGSIIRTVEKIHQKFELALPVNTLGSFQRGEYEGTVALYAHNRYFTDRRLAPQQEHQPFLPMVDPYGALDKLRSQTFIHSCDNIVEYTSLRKDAKGNDEYFVINPATFGLGDIVEISVGFCTKESVGSQQGFPAAYFRPRIDLET